MTVTERITLLDSLSSELLRIPYPAMREVGPAAQTLAGLLMLTPKETFAPVSDIARGARLPLKTARNHLVLLADRGWIANGGRGHTRTGAPRRTCTIRVTQKTRDSLSEYGLLPWWACAKIIPEKNRWKSFSWGARAVLSVLMSKLAALKTTLEPGIGKGWIDHDEFWIGIADRGDEQHFALPLRYLETVTGLSKHALIDAKRSLAEWGIVERDFRHREDGGDDAEILYPNSRFIVSRESIGDSGRCQLRIERKAS